MAFSDGLDAAVALVRSASTSTSDPARSVLVAYTCMCTAAAAIGSAVVPGRPHRRCLLCCCCVGPSQQLACAPSPPSPPLPPKAMAKSVSREGRGACRPGLGAQDRARTRPGRTCSSRKASERKTRWDHHHHAPWKWGWEIVIRGHQEGTDGAGNFRDGPSHSKAAFERSWQPQRFKSEFRRIFRSMRLRGCEKMREKD